MQLSQGTTWEVIFVEEKSKHGTSSRRHLIPYVSMAAEKVQVWQMGIFDNFKLIYKVKSGNTKRYTRIPSCCSTVKRSCCTREQTECCTWCKVSWFREGCMVGRMWFEIEHLAKFHFPFQESTFRIFAFVAQTSQTPKIPISAFPTFQYWLRITKLHGGKQIFTT